MIPGIGERPVADDEWMARYILRKEQVRADGTLKPDPFMPYKWVKLSATRHLGLGDAGIWEAGDLVATETGATLQGRALINGIPVLVIECKNASKDEAIALGVADKVVARALDPKLTRGLVWHTQGSGKTYTMNQGGRNALSRA